MEIALVTSADVWEMPDERTGELRRGVSVWFLNQYREDTDTQLGYKPSKISAPPEVLDQLKGKLPGFFKLSFGSRPGAQGKATLTLIGVDHVKNADLFGSVSAPEKSGAQR